VREFLAGITPGALGTLQGLLIGSVAVLALFIGFCVVFNFPKLRRSGRHTRVVRGLDELIGVQQTFLAPDAPRGTVDQLRTPELLEALARKSS
jgi:hypothetical protein